jgi:hypothetical protein
MSRRLVSALVDVLRRAPVPATTHVHAGSVGAAAVCNDPRCLARRAGQDDT